MSTKEEEYRDIFLTEAIENFNEINRLLIVLEKNPEDIKSVHALFRITHTLKGNATGMGFEHIAELAHVLEDLFGAVREGKVIISSEMFVSVYKAADILNELIDAVKNPREVKYRGIKTKLEVMLRSALAERSQSIDETVPAASGYENAIAPELLDMLQNDDEDHIDTATKLSFSHLVQVPVQKLDNLLNLVGELVIERDRIIASGMHSASEYSRLNRISSDLQYSVMDVRLVPVDFLFNKFHRIVRDAASKEEKNVSLKLKGTETEIDRNILQVISDSLIHLVRNAIGHGIEKPEARKQSGKPEYGTVTLEASSESDIVIIAIQDDGGGIDAARIRKRAVEKGILTLADASQWSDRDIIMLIFEPGFSTMDEVTSLAGRGVGMDVVKRALDSIGGTVHIETKVGEGTTFFLRLPSSMAVKATLLFELDNETFAIPLSYTERVISVYKSDIHTVANGLITVYQGRTISLIFLNDLFRQERSSMATLERFHPEAKLEIVVVSFNGRLVGFIVDKLLQQKEIIEKPLQKPADGVSFISGVTILGNGKVCLVLSIPGILNTVNHTQHNKISL
ncbi:chemotaxis protein CheA [Ohtaekwangia kribbensis]|uniref:Chemotaxis protein CheA n=1 Tax=Ohtaekwangia kribbensis TaxID=688913 RepID=A0ABW3JXS0_9BACT